MSDSGQVHETKTHAELLQKFHEELLTYSGNIKFDKSDQVHRTLLMLYGTMLEFAGCMVLILNSRERIGVQSVFRSLLEAAVEFRNLSNDPAYFEHIAASEDREWLKILREAKGGNKYLAALADPSNLNWLGTDIDQLINGRQDRLADLEQRGIRPLKIFDKFCKADMMDEYKSFYNFLSCDSHSNLMALIQRHIDFNEDEYEVVFYKDIPIKKFFPEIDSAAGLLIEASISIHERFQSDRLSQVKLLEAELEIARSKHGSNES